MYIRIIYTRRDEINARTNKFTIIAFLAWAAVALAGITYGPYLTCPSTGGATVQFGKDFWDSAKIYWADSAAYAVAGSLAYSADITTYDLRTSYNISGYTPNTRIYYRIKAGSDTSPIYSFRTMPEEESRIVFALYGDCRTGEAQHTAIAERMFSYSPSFVINTGDLGDVTWEVGDWKMYFDASDTISARVPFVSAIGNHEIPYTIYKYLFDLPGNEEWYKLDLGCVTVIVLNLYTSYLPGSAQYEWLTAVLEDSIPPTTRWIVAVQHESPYSTSNHGSNLVARETLVPLYIEHNVSVVAAGHDHCYEHSFVDDIHYFVTGGGGAGLYSVAGGSYTVYCERAYHFIIAEADTSDLCFTTYRIDGSTMERFCLSDFTVGVQEARLPDRAYIYAYPNPFNSSVSIIAPENADIDIFEIDGRIVHSESAKAGTPAPPPLGRGNLDDAYRKFIWHPEESVGSGIYLVRARLDDGSVVSKRIVYLK